MNVGPCFTRLPQAAMLYQAVRKDLIRKPLLAQRAPGITACMEISFYWALTTWLRSSSQWSFLQVATKPSWRLRQRTPRPDSAAWKFL